MSYLILKAILSAIIIVAVSEVARRSPGIGALISALPLIAVLSMIWLGAIPAMPIAWRNMPRGPSGVYCPRCRCSC